MKNFESFDCAAWMIDGLTEHLKIIGDAAKTIRNNAQSLTKSSSKIVLSGVAAFAMSIGVSFTSSASSIFAEMRSSDVMESGQTQLLALGTPSEVRADSASSRFITNYSAQIIDAVRTGARPDVSVQTLEIARQMLQRHLPANKADQQKRIDEIAEQLSNLND